MFKQSIAIIASLASCVAIAQPAATTQEPSASSATAATAPAVPQKSAAVSPVLAIVEEGATSGDRPSDFCSIDSGTSLPTAAIVVAVRKVPCVSRYGASFNKELLEIYYAGKSRIVRPDSIKILPVDQPRFDAMTPEQVDASRDEWMSLSITARRVALESVLKALNATAKHGAALLDSSIFDVSEHTEGTGFKVSIYNSSKKTIKYVTFSVVGLNAVGDPVAGRLGRGATLRGIGPIEPGESAGYSREYMWMTDIVESFRIASIKLEYMDGSSKLITDTRGIKISARDVETMRASD